MRDTNENMIEIIGVEKVNNMYFSIIRLILDGEILTLKFNVESGDYSYIKKIVEFRPFEDTSIGKYRYFFSGSYSIKKNAYTEFSLISVRVEQPREHKQFEFPVSKKYVSNLRWFHETKDKNKFEKLIIEY